MPQTAIDIDQWEAGLRSDRRVNASARQIASVLAQHFRQNDGRCQLSLEAIARAANMVSLTSVRNALASLRLSGWITSERVRTTARHGMQYRPMMPQQAEQAVTTTQHASA
jgi:hypothetical protein